MYIGGTRCLSKPICPEPETSVLENPMSHLNQRLFLVLIVIIIFLFLVSQATIAYYGNMSSASIQIKQTAYLPMCVSYTIYDLFLLFLRGIAIEICLINVLFLLHHDEVYDFYLISYSSLLILTLATTEKTHAATNLNTSKAHFIEEVMNL